MTTRHLALCLSVAIGLVGCGRPAPDITVEYLLAHPEELKALQQKCRLERFQMHERVCLNVSEAQRIRFFGNGGTNPYKPYGAGHE